MLLNKQDRVEESKKRMFSQIIINIFEQQRVTFVPEPKEKLVKENKYIELLRGRLTGLIDKNKNFIAQPFTFNKYPDIDVRTLKIIDVIKEQNIHHAIQITLACKKNLEAFFINASEKEFMKQNKKNNFWLGISSYFVYSRLIWLFDQHSAMITDIEALQTVRERNQANPVIMEAVDHMQEISKITASLRLLRTFYRFETKFRGYLDNILVELLERLKGWSLKMKEAYAISIDLTAIEAQNQLLKHSGLRSLGLSTIGDGVDTEVAIAPLTYHVTKRRVWTSVIERFVATNPFTAVYFGVRIFGEVLMNAIPLAGGYYSTRSDYEDAMQSQQIWNDLANEFPDLVCAREGHEDPLPE